MPEGTVNVQAYAQAQFPKENPIGTPMMTETTRGLSDIRRHYWEA
jgi:hypothetical protein